MPKVICKRNYHNFICSLSNIDIKYSNSVSPFNGLMEKNFTPDKLYSIGYIECHKP